jgi:hypothetical protein
MHLVIGVLELEVHQSMHPSSRPRVGGWHELFGRRSSRWFHSGRLGIVVGRRHGELGFARTQWVGTYLVLTYITVKHDDDKAKIDDMWTI